MKKILIGLVGLVLAWMTQAGDDIDAVAAAVAANPAPAPDAPMRLKAVKAMSLQAAGADSGFKDYVYDATGELNVTKGEGTISLNFAVDRHFTEIESAKIVFNAYDVDYPEATEHDVAHFNDASYIRLQGGNNAWHQNSFSVPPEKIRLPETTGQVANNSFYVTVDIDDGGWVTSIGWARLEIRGKEGIVLEASDGTDLDGIKVTWTEVKGVSSYDLYRSDMHDGGFKKIATVFGTEYLDETADYDHPFYYYVETRGSVLANSSGGKTLLAASSSAKSNTDDGLKGDDAIPDIKNIQVAQLFLTGEGPYNVKVEWNDFDEERYCVESIKFSLEKKGYSEGYKFETEEVNLRNQSGTAITDFDLAQGGHTIDEDKYGEYALKAFWKIYDIKARTVVKKGILFWKKDDEKAYKHKGTVKVYFRKYERYANNEANWFTFWQKDGAIDKLGKFKYVERDCNENNICNAAGYRKDWSRTGNIVDLVDGHVIVEFPYIIETYKENPIPLTVSDDAVLCSTPIELRNGETVGAPSSVCGINYLAATISHELKHQEFGSILCKNGVRLLKPNGDYIKPEDIQMKEVEDGFKGREFGAKTQVMVDDYLSRLRDIVTNPSKYAFDTDGDGVPDNKEGGLIFGLFEETKVDNPDTHDFAGGHFQGGGSTGYTTAKGDNEYLAHKAEDKPVKTYPKKDWAFPGSQLGSEPEVMGAKNGSSQIKSAKERYQSVGWTAMSFANAVAAKKKGALAAASGMNESNLSSSGPLYDLDFIPKEEYSRGLTVLGGESLGVQDADGDGRFDSLRFRVSMSNQELDAGRYYCLAGYLVDSDGVPVAWAKTWFPMTSGALTADLTFDGEVIYGQRGQGYELRAVRIDEAYVDLAESVAAKIIAVSSKQNYVYSQFARKDAYVLVNAAADRKIGDALVIDVDCEINVANASYRLSASLSDTNGNHVATATPLQVFGSGRQSLKFPASEIYMSKCNGPYVLNFVQLSNGAGQNLGLLDAYTTAVYSYCEFSPNDIVVSVDAESFAAEKILSQQDGRINSLAFTFKVQNTKSTSLAYRLEANLYDTYGDFVATESIDTILTSGDNDASIRFSGEELAQTQVRGPYVLHDIKLIPLGDEGNVERFFPKMEPLDLNPEDFGAYPFDLRGEPVVSEGGNAAYTVTVPLNIYRANTVTVSALMVDADGKYVATAKRTIQYISGGWTDIPLEFSVNDIQASGRRGPYTIRYLQISSDLEGIEPLRVTSFKSEQISRQYYLYVDASRPDDSGDGLTYATAKRTIQAAVDKAKDGDVVLVMNGTYGPFDTDNKSIEVRSYYGYQYTTVDARGLSRCVTLGHEEMQTNSVLNGFTLVNGDSTGDELFLYNCGGGVCCGTVQNCKISDCVASKGGGTYSSWLENCLVVENTAEGYGGGAFGSVLLNCTVVGNHANYSGGGIFSSEAYNSIIWGNEAGSYSTYEDNWEQCEIHYSLTAPLPSGGIGNLTGDPCFKDAANGNYTLDRKSHCFDAGYDGFVRTAYDLAGNMRITSTAVDLGAFERYRHPRTEGAIEFADLLVEADEGGTAQIEVCGGLPDRDCSATLYLTPASATTEDLSLPKTTKFPMTLTWKAGDQSPKIVKLPIKADALLEGPEELYLQLAKVSGAATSPYSLCRLAIQDRSVPPVSLAVGANAPGIKVTTSGTGKWKVANENEFFSSLENRGLCHAESPALKKGKSATLSFSGIQGKGKLYVIFRFTGNERESTSSMLKITADKKAMRTYYHSSTGNGWQSYYVDFKTTGNHSLSYAFTQGSDLATRAEVVAAYWVPSGAADPSMVYVSSFSISDGYVTGMGLYRKGTKATIVAKPNAGRTFVGWYLWSEATRKYEPWKTTAKVTFTVSGQMDVMALFAVKPYVTVLSEQPERGTVSGGGYCASGKTVTLKATARTGYVFSGWYLNGNRVSLAATASVKGSGDNETYYARFVTLAEDKASIGATVSGLAFAAAGTDKVSSLSTNAMCGVALSWPLSHAAFSATSVKVTGLPTGLKYDTKKKAIVGTPTAPGKTSSVKVAVTTAGKATATFTLKVAVVALPEWAKGQFTGTVWPVAEGRDSTEGTVLTMSVGSTGKVSGKFKQGATNWTFSASSFAAASQTAADPVRLVCSATAKGTYKAKSGKTTVTKTVTAPLGFTLVAAPDVSPIASSGLGDFAGGTDNVEIRRVAGVRLSVDGVKGGTVKMDKSYGQVASGKSVKFTATLTKGYTLLGWYDAVTGARLSQATSFSLKMAGADRVVVARFAKESDLSASDFELKWNAPTNLTVGVSYSASPKVSGSAAVKIASVTGLPSGLSYKSGKVTGVATTAKTNTVSVTFALATNAKKKFTLKQKLVVAPLPAWATQTFEGNLGTEDEPVPVTVTVASNGNVSGKYKLNGATWTFSAKSFSSAVYDAETGEPVSFAANVTATATISKKKKSQKLVVTVTEEGADIRTP